MLEFSGHRNVICPVNHCLALVAVGGNLPGPAGQTALATCQSAIVELNQLPEAYVCGLSRWFVSEPVPPSGQPDYINAVAALWVGASIIADPARLLIGLQAIEAGSGRLRGERNAARTLDLDIIAVGDVVRRSPDPVLPHPRTHQRAFVLLPLQDVAPDWVHPVLRRSVGHLIAELPPQRIRPLPA